MVIAEGRQSTCSTRAISYASPRSQQDGLEAFWQMMSIIAMLTRRTRSTDSQVGTGDSYSLSFCTTARPMTLGSLDPPAGAFIRIYSGQRAYQILDTFVLVLAQGAAIVLGPSIHHTMALPSRILPSLLHLASQYAGYAPGSNSQNPVAVPHICSNALSARPRSLSTLRDAQQPKATQVVQDLCASAAYRFVEAALQPHHAHEKRSRCRAESIQRRGSSTRAEEQAVMLRSPKAPAPHCKAMQVLSWSLACGVSNQLPSLEFSQSAEDRSNGDKRTDQPIPPQYLACPPRPGGADE
jgi:hypothetical protein